MEHGLDTQVLAVVAAGVIVWGLLSARLERLNVSAPIAFVVFGLVVANKPLSLVDVTVRGTGLRSVAELTLALLLFSDAARVGFQGLRHDTAVPLRLLVIGLPLTVAVGSGIAVILFPDINPWTAAVIAAVVAPTDAALGAEIVENPRIPRRTRRVLNVESGLNDGIATPFVSFFIAGAVAEEVAHSGVSLVGAIGDLGIGVVTGTALGLGGAILLRVAQRAGWSASGYRAITVLALALLAYSLAIQLGGNGFIAAFVGGLAFGTILSADDREANLEFDAQTGELLSLIVWFLFGAVMLTALDATTWETVAFAVLALTVIRMVPVAIALIGTHLSRPTVMFIGWFGPRGLASVVFGLVAFDALAEPDARVVLAAVTLTVLMSVLAHGVTATPFSRLYGAHAADLDDRRPEPASTPVLPSRPRTRVTSHRRGARGDQR